MPSFNHELLRSVRLDLGLTQEQAAAALGVDVRTYRRYECGAVNEGGDFHVRHAARRQLLRRMCEEFGIASEADWLAMGPPQGAEASPPAAAASLEQGATHLDPNPSTAAPSLPAMVWRPYYAQPLQRAPHFVGRAALLASLEAWHQSPAPTPRVIALVGVGGSGKTATVERFLRSPAVEAGPGGAFTWSFYDDARVEALLAQALAYFANESAGAEGGRLERLNAVLRRGPRHLLIFDGLEALQSEGGNGRALGEIDQPALRRLVRAIAAGLGETRLLLTSRLRPTDLEPWEGAEVMTLAPGELARDEAKELLRAWGLDGEEGSLDRLVDRVGGHALSVAVLGSYGGAFLGGDARRADDLVLDEAARDDPRARRLAGVLAAYAAALEPIERDALARLSVFGGAASIDRFVDLAAAGGAVAGALAESSDASIARALGRLERLGLVYRAGNAPPHFAAHPFVRGFFKSFVDTPAERIHEALRGSLAARLEGPPRAGVAEATALDTLETLFVHTLESGRLAEAWLLYTRGFGGFDHLGLRLGAMGRGARLLQRFARDADPTRLRPDLPPTLAALVTYDWGLYAGALGDLERARRCYEAQTRAIAALDDESARPSMTAMGRRTLAYTHWLLGDLDQAAAQLEASLALARAIGSRFHLTRGLALLAAVEHDRGHPEAAQRLLEGAREHDPKPVARRAFWEAELRLALGQATAGAALARQGLAYCERKAWPGHVAHGHVLLGESALLLLQPEAAQAHLDRARPWALASGEVEMALRCHQLASRLALARGHAEHALHHARLGLEPSRPPRPRARRSLRLPHLRRPLARRRLRRQPARRRPRRGRSTSHRSALARRRLRLRLGPRRRAPRPRPRRLGPRQRRRRARSARGCSHATTAARPPGRSCDARSATKGRTKITVRAYRNLQQMVESVRLNTRRDRAQPRERPAGSRQPRRGRPARREPRRSRTR
ncbi:MAG: NACHT domain-containing protein [Polyangiaceae bacterium]|nr:NACHT domain-containing protein [Polyangiaceae bacterium]